MTRWIALASMEPGTMIEAATSLDQVMDLANDWAGRWSWDSFADKRFVVKLTVGGKDYVKTGNSREDAARMLLRDHFPKDAS